MTLHLSPEEILERNKEKQRQWRIDHPERVRAFHCKYNAKPEVALRKSEWAKTNRQIINTRRREVYASRRPKENVGPNQDSTDEQPLDRRISNDVNKNLAPSKST